MVNVSINGFGRIGRMILKAGLNRPDINFVAINDLADTKTLAHLLKYDSVQGVLDQEVHAKENALVIGNIEIPVYAEKDPKNLPWADLNVDVALECTGFFRKRDDAAKHLKAGAKKVVISAPSGDADFMMVKGVNEHDYDPEKHHVISNASCTTNCIAPMTKVLNDNFRIIKGFMITIHSYTGDQKLIDAPHPDLRRTRSAAVNIIPTSTGAARAVGKVIPEMEGKMDGKAIRVPTVDGSLTEFICEVEKGTSIEEINGLFKSVAGHHLSGILEYSEDPLVSTDILGNPHSCIFDSQLTNVIDGTLINISGWYDNEWGYSNRMIDILPLII